MELIQRAIAQLMLQLGWTTRQRHQFILDMFEKSETELTEDDWKLMLLEVQSRVQDAGYY